MIPKEHNIHQFGHGQ